jgi:hypothetical protein
MDETEQARPEHAETRTARPRREAWAALTGHAGDEA